jgi:hypothetical protein
MLLTDFNDEYASISQRLTNKKIFGISGTFTVPAGVNKIYYTGVAGGGRGGGSILNPVTGWASAKVSIGVSSDEGYCFATNATITTDAPLISAAGRKVSKISNVPFGGSDEGGQECYVADNGFAISHAASSRYTIDGGLTWQNTSGIASGYSSTALMPTSKESSSRANRCAFLGSTGGQLAVWSGGTWLPSAYSGKVFGSMSYANNYFVATESNVTTKTSIYYKTAADATLASGWTAVVVDGTNEVVLNDSGYGNGVYVLVGAGGVIYTATSLAGPWTARTSNTINNINAVKYAGARWVAVCSGGDILTATDPTAAWTKTASVGGAVDRYRKDLQYLSITSHWCVSVSDASVTPKYSTDAITWTNNTAGISIHAIAATSSGLLCMTNAGVAYVIPDPQKAAYITLSTSGDGGDCKVIRGSTGEELLRLAGGITGGGTNGGAGGSSTRLNMIGGQSTTAPAIGPRGNGAINTPTNYYGGGICPFVEDLLLNDGNTGIKIPGGGGAFWVASAFSEGGLSIMAGPGSGMSSSTAGAGGGGEGVVRFQIDVTPGEILAFGNGLAQTSTSSAYNPQHGFGMIEWEAA